MKKFYRVKFKLLTPLFYWSKISDGIVFTDNFIGDLALYYAINKVNNIKDVKSSFYGEFQPNYNEIRDFNFFISCARPLETSRTDILAHKTEFKAEVTNKTPKLEEKSRSSPFKSYFKQQGIEATSTFEAIAYCEEGFLPPSIRVGTHLHTLVEVNAEEIDNLKNKDLHINLFSWQEIFELSSDLSNGHIEYKLPIYMIYKTEISEQIEHEIKEFFN